MTPTEKLPSSQRDPEKPSPDSDAAPTLRQGPRTPPEAAAEEPAAIQRPPSDS